MATEEQVLAALPRGPDLSPERQTARMVMRPLAFLEELRAEFGDVFTLRLLDEGPLVAISDPELIKQVFKAPADVLRAGEGRRVLRRLMGDNSVMLLDGARHAEQRRLLLPPFGAGQIKRYEEAMRAAAEHVLEEWPLGVEQRATIWARAITLEVILRVVLGAGHSRRIGDLREAFRHLRLPRNERESRAPAFGSVVERIDELVFAEIAERAGETRSGDRGDVLSLLLAARHEDGAPMSTEEIRDELITLLAAGYETTATTLAWALERLARNPAALALTEVEAAAGGGPYTDAVIKETLRLRPAVPVLVRTAKARLELGGHAIPAGAAIVPAILLVHHRPDIYPDPYRFRPERFLDTAPEPYAWLPFGGGERRCIGARFALLEMRVILAALLARASVRAAEPEPEPMRRRDITLSPASGARVSLEPR